jgi:hypothetical protein
VYVNIGVRKVNAQPVLISPTARMTGARMGILVGLDPDGLGSGANGVFGGTIEAGGSLAWKENRRRRLKANAAGVRSQLT